jgi:biopolymer transport protein ExbD
VNWSARTNQSRRTYRGITFDQLRALVLDGELAENDWVQREGDVAWTELGAVPELADALPAFTFRRDRATQDIEEDMDMTPMIDVVFQLLLFFMLISTFQVQKAIGFPDPGDTKEAKNVPTLGQLGRDRVLVAINAQNQIELLHYDGQGKESRREPIKREDLTDRFSQIAKNERKTAVLIQADDKAQHDSVIAVIDAAYQANMEDIRIAEPVETGKADKPATSVTPKPGGAARKVEDQ